MEKEINKDNIVEVLVKSIQNVDNVEDLKATYTLKEIREMCHMIWKEAQKEFKDKLQQICWEKVNKGELETNQFEKVFIEAERLLSNN